MDIKKEYKQIAAAVLEQAIKDLTCKAKDRVSFYFRHKAYYYFRRNNKHFAFWCEVLELDPETALEKIKKEYADDFKRVFNEIRSDRSDESAKASKNNSDISNKRKKDKPGLNDFMREVEEYNRSHGTYLTYGQYTTLTKK